MLAYNYAEGRGPIKWAIWLFLRQLFASLDSVIDSRLKGYYFTLLFFGSHVGAILIVSCRWIS